MTFRPASPAPVKWKRWFAAAEVLPNLLLTTLAVTGTQAPFTAPDTTQLWKRPFARSEEPAPNLLLTTLAPVQVYPGRTSEQHGPWPRWKPQPESAQPSPGALQPPFSAPREAATSFRRYAVQFDTPQPSPSLLAPAAQAPFTGTPEAVSWRRFGRQDYDAARNLALLSPAVAQSPFTGPFDVATWRIRPVFTEDARNLLPLLAPPAAQAPFSGVSDQAQWRRSRTADEPRNLAPLLAIQQAPFTSVDYEIRWTRARPQPEAVQPSPGALQPPFTPPPEEGRRLRRWFVPPTDDNRNLVGLTVPTGTPQIQTPDITITWRRWRLVFDGPQSMSALNAVLLAAPDEEYTVALQPPRYTVALSLPNYTVSID